MWAIGGVADAHIPGPQTPLGLWLREVWEPLHTTAGWVVGGVKVRPESKWATVKNAPQPTNSRPQRAGRSAGWGEPRRLCPGYQAESARLKMVGPVTAVLRHLRKAAERGHPRGTRPRPTPGSRHLYVLIQLYLQNRQVDPSSLTAAGNRGQSLSRRPRVSKGRLSRQQEEELLCSRRPLPPGHPRMAGGRDCWPEAALP